MWMGLGKRMDQVYEPQHGMYEIRSFVSVSGLGCTGLESKDVGLLVLYLVWMITRFGVLGFWWLLSTHFCGQNTPLILSKILEHSCAENISVGDSDSSLTDF